MKSLLLLTLVVSLFSGCSQTTAFDFFKMDADYERAISNLQTGTITRSFETEVILSSIYLNKVYPKQYHDGEYFFIALYVADKKRRFLPADLRHSDYKLTLNGVDFITATELTKEEKLRAVMPINNEWNRYYLVRFEKQHRDDLVLQFEDDRLEKISLHYHQGDATKRQEH